MPDDLVGLLEGKVSSLFGCATAAFAYFFQTGPVGLLEEGTASCPFGCATAAWPLASRTVQTGPVGLLASDQQLFFLPLLPGECSLLPTCTARLQQPACPSAPAPPILLHCKQGDLRNVSYEDSKYLGGDVAHTHLVKGLDFALLHKVTRREWLVVDMGCCISLLPLVEGLGFVALHMARGAVLCCCATQVAGQCAHDLRPFAARPARC